MRAEVQPSRLYWQELGNCELVLERQQEQQ